ENQVDNRIGSVAHPPHGGQLCFGEAAQQPRSDKFRNADNSGFGADCGELALVMIDNLHAILGRPDIHYAGVTQHALLELRLEDFDELVGYAAEAAWKNDAMVGAGGDVLEGADANECRGVGGGCAPVGWAVTVPPLLNFWSVAGRVFAERLGIKFSDA